MTGKTTGATGNNPPGKVSGKAKTAKKPRGIKARGFASMTPERRREVASMGGKAVEPENRSFSRDRSLAVKAGKIGGTNVAPDKRLYAIDRDKAVAAGRKGGTAVHAKTRTSSKAPKKKTGDRTIGG